MMFNIFQYNDTILLLLLSFIPKKCYSHSWIVNVGHDGGLSRGGNIGSDTILQRYFCPLPNLDDCQPDPKHGIVLTEDALRPCRENVESKHRAYVRSGEELYISWMGNGHAANGQSDDTCVNVMLAPFAAAPDISDFVQIPGAECIDYWHYDTDGIPKTDTEISIPANTPPGSYTLFWYWNFTEFWYSSCADIEILPSSSPTKPPITPGPTINTPTAPTSPTTLPSPKPTLNTDLIEQYLNHGCNELVDPNAFCVQYLGVESYCKSYNVDECGRSVCHEGDFLLPCQSVPTASPTIECPPGQANLIVEFQADSKATKQNRYVLHRKKKKKGWKLLVKRKKIKRNTLDIYAICIKDNICHKFTIQDKGGDGLCCDYGNGYYKLIKNGKELVHSSIPNGKKEIVKFGGPCDKKEDDMDLYLRKGCNTDILPTLFCTNNFGSGSYCKDYQEDDCGRSVCQGHSHEDLDPCS